MRSIYEEVVIRNKKFYRKYETIQITHTDIQGTKIKQTEIINMNGHTLF